MTELKLHTNVRIGSPDSFTETFPVFAVLTFHGEVLRQKKLGVLATEYVSSVEAQSADWRLVMNSFQRAADEWATQLILDLMVDHEHVQRIVDAIEEAL